MIIQLKLDDMRGEIPPLKPSNGCFIAGGAIRRWFTGKEDLSDVDVFAPSEANHAAYLATIGNAVKLDETANAVTYQVDKTKLQLIKHYRASVQELVDSFDFNVCQFAWDESGIWATPEAAIGTLRGHLSIAKITKEFSIDSLRRAFKYQNKGFKPCDGTIRDISKVISELSKEEVEAQVTMSPKGGSRIVRFD